MNGFWKIAVCFAVGLALNAGLCADNPASATSLSPDNNPYSTVAVRNIFGLIPPAPPVVVDPNVDAEKKLPKITPTGIMSSFGFTQVLFKVSTPANTGQPPAKDEFYILSEGQRQDDIEVVTIDDKKSIVTFDNHGFTQNLPLANAPASGGGAGSSPGGRNNPGMAPGQPGGGVGNNGNIIRFGGSLGGRNGSTANINPNPNSDAGNGANSGMGFGGSSEGRTYQPEAPTMSPEDSQATLVINHLKAQMAGDPTANLYPPTPHDQEAGITPPDGSPPQ